MLVKILVEVFMLLVSCDDNFVFDCNWNILSKKRNKSSINWISLSKIIFEQLNKLKWKQFKFNAFLSLFKIVNFS